MTQIEITRKCQRPLIGKQFKHRSRHKEGLLLKVQLLQETTNAIIEPYLAKDALRLIARVMQLTSEDNNIQHTDITQIDNKSHQTVQGVTQ